MQLRKVACTLQRTNGVPEWIYGYPENGEGSLDKEATSHDDLFDSFCLSLQFWH